MAELCKSDRAPLGRVAARFKNALAATASGLLLFAAQADAQQQPSSQDLAKLVQNPLASTISVPFANETNFPLGPYGQAGNILNIQPVIPFSLNKDWNVVTRTTIPVSSQVRLSPSDPSEFGIGDVVPIIALTPAHPGDLIWGVGPTLSLPTATGPNLGARQWAAGPAAIMLVQPDPWGFGILLSQLWSLDAPRDVAPINRTAAQLFVFYNLADGWFLSYSPIFLANWAADSRDRWTVPVGGDIGRVFEIGSQAISATAGIYYNAVHPDDGPEWQARVNLTLIYPQ